MEERLPRKLAVILYADVAGYSRLTGDDEDATHRSLSEYLDLISSTTRSHRGQVVHYAGDAVLARFDAAVDALSSAAAVQHEISIRNQEVPQERKVKFRIGINLGDVIEDRGDIYGDGVNVAARLEALAEPGGICISDAVRAAVGKKLDLDYEDMGEQEVRNIAESVRAYRVVMEEKSETVVISPETPALELPDKPSIAVLPFTNMSGDPEQEYFSDGVTEDIITELSKFRSLSVIARHSSFSFKGRAVKVQEIAKDLQVEYVVEGSLRRAGNRIRITAQLIEGSSGNHVWAERYDRELEDLFSIQDEVTQTIVSRVATRLDDAGAERAKHKPPHSMNAYDHFLRGLQQYANHGREPLEKARQHFQKAIELDPGFARARAYVALTIFTQAFYVYTDNSQLDVAMTEAREAVSLDGDESAAHAAVGLILYMQGLDIEAMAHVKRALALNPNDAEIIHWLGFMLTYSGHLEESIVWLEIALRLNPLHGNIHTALGITLYLAKRYEEALEMLSAVTGARRWPLCYLAATLAQLGRTEESHPVAQRFVKNVQAELRERGEVAPSSGLEMAQIETAFFRRHTDAEHLLDGLRKAGLS